MSKKKIQRVFNDLCIIEDCTYEQFQDSLCNIHLQSLERLEESFKDWKKAYEKEISWEKYLQFIVENSTGTVGKYNQEMASYLLDDTEAFEETE